MLHHTDVLRSAEKKAIWQILVKPQELVQVAPFSFRYSLLFLK
jgi:hypothetical protein